MSSPAQARTAWLLGAALTIATMAVAWALVALNQRLLPSWHGFVHVGIAGRFPSQTFIPENPFYAGEPVSYYWWYQWLGHVLARALATDVLHVFQGMSLASLGLLVGTGVAIGWRKQRSVAAGALIAYLVLAGSNPLGPAIAAAKHLTQGQALAAPVSASAGNDVFVSNAEADARMTRPALGALYFSTDWRFGQNLIWFIDISARGPSIALLALCGGLLLLRRRPAVVALLCGGVGFLIAALNPVVGLAASATLLGAATLTVAAAHLWPATGQRDLTLVVRTAAMLLGAVAAAPTYINLFGVSGATSLSSVHELVIKGALVASCFAVLAAFAVLGVARASADDRPGIATLAVAGLTLVLATPIVALSEGNEHNLANAAYALLAIPAVWWTCRPDGGSSPFRTWLLFLVFVPVTAASLWSVTGRPPLPLVFPDGRMHRAPAHAGLDAFYEWARASTPRDAVFVVNPDEPVKMSGNVSEVPAFTERALYVDQLTYMTSPYADREARASLARRLSSGERPPDADMAPLRGLGRPVYVASFHPSDAAERLRRDVGPAAFQNDAVIVVGPLAPR